MNLNVLQPMCRVIAAGAVFGFSAPALAEPDDRTPITVTDPVRPPTPPGQLRDTGGIRPVGGSIRPTGGGLRPVGGSLRPVGGDMRPIQVNSPLQNDASFNARTRPRTPQYGVTGTVVEPGWDNPPWNDGSTSTSPGFIVNEGPSGLPEGAASSSINISGLLTPPTRNWTAAPVGIDLSAVGRQQMINVDAPAASSPRQVPPATRGGGASARDDRGWFETAPVRSSRPPGDVRAELRMAARLVSGGRLDDATAVLRDAVYRNPEAFRAGQAAAGLDAATRERLRSALNATSLPSADAAFMDAAIAAALGESQRASNSIRMARELGEARPSGKALHRVLVPEPTDYAPSPAPAPAMEGLP